MNNRRNFIKKSTALAGILPFLGMTNSAEAGEFEFQDNYLNSPAGNDEDFWAWVRDSFSLSTNIINLNNGGVSPQPKVVQEAHIRNYQLSNEAPTYYMWRILDQGREPLRRKLADLLGAKPDEIAINRNCTEGLNSIVFGMKLQPGDEVVLSLYDYPNIINAWKQREKRDGIKLNWVDIKFPAENEDEVVAAFGKSITDKTKVVYITHVINWTGQILPVRKIANLAHSKGCEVIVDGAHSFAHLDYKIADLDCDYYATSLHKWLCAPFGTGMMYIKKDKIAKIWPLLSNDNPESEDIHKFESLGTRSFAAEMAIGAAIDFHLAIGIKRKQERLFFLKNYWATKAAQIPKVSLNTSLKPEFSGALCNFSIEGWTATEIESKLFEKYKIHTSPVIWGKVNGARVTPHVYTTTRELDVLVNAIEDLAAMVPPEKKK